MAYDAFISYSHARDGLLAPRLQQSLQRFAKPWWRLRALRVFQDESALSVNPGLWTSIVEALDESQWFVLLASPEAAKSDWVNREVAHWCKHHDPTRVLPVLTEGEWIWDSDVADFDWNSSTAVPAALHGVFSEEPRHIDMRWARTETQLDLRNGRFRDQVAALAAPMHGLAKDEMEGEDVRSHRRTMRIAWAAVVALLLLLGASVAAGAQALQAADEARESEQQALAARDEADRQTQLAVASAGEAERRKQQADESTAEASRQRGQAEANALEAERQRVEADRNAANAEAQRRATDAANATLATTVDQLTTTNEALDRSTSDLEDANAELDDKNDELIDANNALGDTNEKLDQTNKTLEDTNQRLADTNTDLQTANDNLAAQAANLDASRLASLATDQLTDRLDVALLLAAEAQRRAATDTRIPESALMRILQADGRGLERMLHVPATPSVLAVSPGDEWIVSIPRGGFGVGLSGPVDMTRWPARPPHGTEAVTTRVDMPNTTSFGREIYNRRAAFGAGGSHLFLERAVVETFLDPNNPPPDMAGLTVIDVNTGAVKLAYEPVPHGRVVMGPNNEEVAVQTCLPTGTSNCEPTVALIDARTGMLIRERPGRLPSHMGAGGATSPEARPSTDFAPDGRSLLVFAPPGEFQLWPLDAPNITISLYTPAVGTFVMPSFDPEAQLVIGSDLPGRAVVYDAADGSVVSVLPVASPGAIRAVTSTAGGVAVLQEGHLTILRDGEATLEVSVDSCATDITTSHAGGWLIVGAPTCRTTDFVEVATGHHTSAQGNNVGVVEMATRTIAYQRTAWTVEDPDSRFGVFDVWSNRWIEVRPSLASAIPPLFDPRTKGVIAGFGPNANVEVTFWSDGRSVALPGAGSSAAYFGASERAAVLDPNGAIAIWNLAEVGRPRQVGVVPAIPNSGEHAMSPRGDLLATLAPNHDALLLTDVESGELVDGTSVPGSSVVDVRFVAGGRLAIANDIGGDVVIRYDIDGRQVLPPIPGRVLAVSPNGRFLVLERDRGRDVLVFDVEADREVARFTPEFGVRLGFEVAVSADGRFLIMNGELYDVRTQRLLRTVFSNLSDFRFERALTFSASGKHVYRFSEGDRSNWTLEVFDTTSWEVIGTYSVRNDDLIPRHLRSELAVSADERLVYVVGDLLDAETLMVLSRPGELLPPQARIDQVGFTVDGRSLRVLSGDAIFDFTVGAGALADRACEIAGRNLTAAEESIYVTSPTGGCPQSSPGGS